MTLVRTRNAKLWDEDHGSHIFQVGNTLYKLDSNALIRVSGFFRDLFSTAPHACIAATTASADAEGTLGCPIVVPQTSEPEFEVFASRAYALFLKPPFANELLIKLLHLGRYLMSPSTVDFALDNIQNRRWHFHPAELIKISHEFNTQLLFQNAFECLVKTPLRNISNDHTYMLEAAEEHQHLVACEPPFIEAHHATCTDNALCSSDWYAVWWNIMGRCLLDARNPLIWDEAVKRLEKAEFGEVNDGCKQMMLRLVSEGTGFAHPDVLIRTKAIALTQKIIEDRGDDETMELYGST